PCGLKPREKTMSIPPRGSLRRKAGNLAPSSPDFVRFSCARSCAELQGRTDCDVEDDLLTAAIRSCRRAHDWQQALALVETSYKRGRIPSRFAFTAAVVVCGKSATWQSAIGLLEKMRLRQGQLDDIALSAVVHACVKGSAWQAALRNPELTSYFDSSKVQNWSRALRQNSWEVALQTLRMRLNELPSKATFRIVSTVTHGVVIQLRSLVRMSLSVDETTAAALERHLGLAARAGVMANFSDEGARAGYTLKHLPSRTQYVTNTLFRASQSKSWLSETLRSLLVGRLCCQVLSIGGGPGFDFAAAVLLAMWLAPMGSHRVTIHACIFDYEPGWAVCADAVSSAVRQKFGQHNRSSCGFVDIRKPLAHPSNAPFKLAAAGQEGQMLVVASYVVSENARELERTRFAFFEELFASALPGTLFVFIDTTHREWPDLLEAAFRGAWRCGRSLLAELRRVESRRSRSHALFLRVDPETHERPQGQSAEQAFAAFEQALPAAERMLWAEFRAHAAAHGRGMSQRTSAISC
ncbi:unnamed protein product, partial [Prorocentrum cordatum]